MNNIQIAFVLSAYIKIRIKKDAAVLLPLVL